MRKSTLLSEEIAEHVSSSDILDVCLVGTWCLYINSQTNHRLLYGNDVFLSLFGVHKHPSPEIFHHYIVSHLVAEDVSRVQGVFEKAQGLYAVQEVECFWQHPQRGRVIVRVVFAAVPSVKEGYYCFKGQASILTSVHALSFTQQATYQFLNIVFNASPMGVALQNECGMPIDCNEALLEMFALKRKEEYCEHFHNLCPKYQINGVLSTEQRQIYIREALAKGRIVVEWFYKRADTAKGKGEVFAAEVTLVATKYNDKNVLTAFIRDLTEEKNARQRLQEQRERIDAMFFANPIGAMLWNTKGEPIECNPAMLNMMGVATTEEYCQNFRSYFPEKQVDGIDSFAQRRGYIEEAYTTGSCKFEWLYQKQGAAKGDTLVTEVTLVPTQYAGDTVLVAFARDITEEKAMIQKLADKKEALQHALVETKKASEVKNNFFANMSHEIRTPMNAILGMSHLCLQKDLDEQVHNYIEKIHTAGKNLLGIINNILDIAKVEAGRFVLENVPFSLIEMLESVGDILHSLALGKPIEVLFDIDPTLPNYFMGDPTRIREVFINIAGNAIKFTEKGYLLVRVCAKTIIGRKYIIAIEVTDTGIGMNENQLQDIFHPFEQVDTTATRRFGGTGLGLTISKNIIEQMNGNISVSSTLGEGTTFTMHIPLYAQEEGWLDVSLAENAKILIVDDCSIACAVLQSMLMQCGFAADSTEHVEDAFDAICIADQDDAAYSVVILDWCMPAMNGYEAAQKIRALPLQKTPALLLTSASALDILKVEDTEVFAGFLSKPVLPSVLWAEVMQALNRTVTLPLDHKALEKTQETELTHTKDLQGVRVLVVEDNEINQEIIKALLEAKGLIVVIANNGLEAVNICQQSTYSCIFMDIQMPIMDGLTATRRIREMEGFDINDVPIIAVTAHAMPMHKEQSKGVGMNAHLSKPIDPIELQNILAKWIAEKHK